MCGIFGVINTNEKIDEGRVLAARDVLAHRGPDDAGIYISPCHPELSVTLSASSRAETRDEGRGTKNDNPPFVALAHRRLSIIDLSPAGHQPMTTPDGRYTIVYNGEIYNYKDLGEQLIVNSNQYNSNQSLLTTHYSLLTNSDTEVILHLYAQYGKDCLNMLRGMFAFAIWDDKEKTLFAARDRFGIKPFYYYKSDMEFIFSSEIKAIKHYKKNLTLSMEGIDAYLRTGSVPAPLTIYNEVKSLLPGHFLEIRSFDSAQDDIKINIEQYWSFLDLFKSFTEHHSLNGKEANRHLKNLLNDSQYNQNAKQKIRSALIDSITAHCVSDVEVGAFLSGGIDSSSIVSLMRQIGHEKLKTISVTFPGFVHDEAEYSNIAAQTFGTDHYEYRLKEQEVVDDLDKIINILDQPTIDGVNTYFVSKAAKSFGLKVVLSGLGGDELFGGYPSFTQIPKYHKIKSLPFSSIAMKAALPFVKNKLPGKAIRFMKEPTRLNSEYILMRGLFTDDELNNLGWNHNFKHPFEIDTMERNAKHNYNDNYPVFNLKDFPLQYISELETNHYMRNQLLRDSDIFSMANSLELRVPFVDHILYSEVLPYLHLGFNRQYSKMMLVNAVGNLPNAISNRLKMGFTFPFDTWMRTGKLNSIIRETLLDKKRNDLFSADAGQNLLNQFDKGRIRWSRLWALFVISKFIE